MAVIKSGGIKGRRQLGPAEFGPIRYIDIPAIKNKILKLDPKPENDSNSARQ